MMALGGGAQVEAAMEKAMEADAAVAKATEAEAEVAKAKQAEAAANQAAALARADVERLEEQVSNQASKSKCSSEQQSATACSKQPPATSSRRARQAQRQRPAAARRRRVRPVVSYQRSQSTEPSRCVLQETGKSMWDRPK